MSRLRSRRLIQAAVYGKAAGGGGFTPSSTQSANFLSVALRPGDRVGAVPTYGLRAITTERNAYDTMITGIVSDLGGSLRRLRQWPIFDFPLYLCHHKPRSFTALNLISSSCSILLSTFTARLRSPQIRAMSEPRRHIWRLS